KTKTQDLRPGLFSDRPRGTQRRGLAEKVLHLAQQAARRGLVFNLHRVAQLMKQIALRLGELLGRLHHNLHHQVSAPMLVEMRNTLTPQAILLARLRALVDAKRGVAFESRHLDLISQRNLRKGDENDAMQIISVALEEFVR